MAQRTKEEELNIVLKNYDKLKAERDSLKKENEDLKSKLTQQETLYKNMLTTYSERKEILPKKWNGEKIRAKFDNLNTRYEKLQAVYSKQQEYIELKAVKLKTFADENIKLRNMIDSLRGALCSAYTKADMFCNDLNVSKRGEDCLNQEFDGNAVVSNPQKMPVSVVEYQQQQFIKYIRDVVDIYKKTGTLNGIARLAQKYSVSAITKVKFFQYRLDDEPLSDKEILEVYDLLKKKKI